MQLHIQYIGGYVYILYTRSIPIHLPEAFAKTKKATNILRPAIDVSFLRGYEEFLRGPSIELERKKIEKKTFFTI